MDRIQLQQRIDKIHWYHDIDFPNGLQARTKAPQAEAHRRQWDWMRSKLDEIDFGGKNVLDIGCWDGYWSFYAEQRGASRVLASDDKSQNWAGNAGLELAKELLDSSVKTYTDVSIYEVTNIGERFDLILCMGVYYHLVDPFYALSQVRHCCRRRCIVVFEGDFAPEGSASSIPGFRAAHFDFENLACCFLPTLPCLRHMLQANYFRVVTESIYHGLPEQSVNRILVTCEPFEGDNTLHFYRPPFGLHAYDPRFR